MIYSQLKKPGRKSGHCLVHVCTIAVGECDSVLVILLADRFPCCDTVINVVSKDASKARHVLKYCWFSYFHI